MLRIYITSDLPVSLGNDLRLLKEFTEAKIVHASNIHLQRTSQDEVLNYLDSHNFELIITKSKQLCAKQRLGSIKTLCLNGNIGRIALSKIILLHAVEIAAFLQSKDRILFLGKDAKVVALLQSILHAG